MSNDHTRGPRSMNRRAMLLATAATAGVAAGTPVVRAEERPLQPARPAARRPNILLIVMDDMGWSDASPYGGEIYTRNIARLADQGCMFSNFHVAPTCSPTRSMLLTGADNHVAGIGNMKELLADNQVGKPGYEGGLNGRAVTLATMLRESGYHTYMAGKWHLGQSKEQLPAAQGFDESVVLAEGGADNWEKKPYTPKYRTVHFFEGFKEIDLPPDFYSSRFYADKLLGYIDKNADDRKPFFAYLAFQAVHQPHQAPADFIERYLSTYQAGWAATKRTRYQRQVELGLMPTGLDLWTPPGTPDWTSLPPDEQRVEAKRMAIYAGMLEYADMSIGRVLDHLDAKKMLDDTVVVFMSDNGGESTELQDYFPEYYRKNFNLAYEKLGEKGSYSEYGPTWANVSMTPFRAFKITASEGGTRAPLIVRYPSKVQEGKRIGAFTYVLDVVPTLLELVGATPQQSPLALDGRSMLPLLAGTSEQIHDQSEMIITEVAGNIAIYRGDHKMVRNLPPFGDKRWRLYDLRLDPTEADDITTAHPELVKTMLVGYADYVARNGVVEVPDGYSVPDQAAKNAKMGGH